MPDENTTKPARRTERIGKYEILGHIATGGMGVIYKARDIDLDRLVALKILPPDMAKQQTTLIRFNREAQAAAKLRHENIVTIFDVGEVNGTHYIALEYIEGVDLQDYINRKCRLDPDEGRQIMIQAARALLHAFENKIVHRDIKPSNLLLLRKDDRFIVKLTDFGLAIRHENDAEFRITRDKTTVGTVDYMSPEQARDSRAADIRSDIYSLGCTAYHMLAGMAPFAKGTLPERIVQHMQSPPPDVRKLNKSVPGYLVTIINKMLAKKPEDRYQTPAELLSDLEHPEQVAPPGKRSAAGIGERTKPQKDAEPTSVIDTKEIEALQEETRQVKPPRDKKPAKARHKAAADDKPASRDLTDEFREPTRPADRRERGKKTSAKTPVWMYIAGATGAILLLSLAALFALSSRNPPKKEVEKKTDPPPVVEGPPEKILLPPVIDTSADKMTVVAPPLPGMGTGPTKADRAALRKEYYGLFSEFPWTPADAPVLLVSRLAEAGPRSFRTIEEAVAQAKAESFTVIEIRDNGPLFLSALAIPAQRFIVLRAADDYRPLIVWDLPKKLSDPKNTPILVSLPRGKLLLENLDVVMRSPIETSAVLFDLPGTDFAARGCTFSVAGKSGPGVALVRRVAAPKDATKTQTWYRRCYARGADLTLLQLHGAAAEVMVEDSVVVGSLQPLVSIRGRDEDEIEIRCVRSTLLSGHSLVRWQALVGKDGTPSVRSWLLDSIVSREESSSGPGDMIHLADGADPLKLQWRVANSVYAGWRQLLASQAKSIAGSDLDAWRREWLYSGGDRAFAESWPATPLTALDEVAPGAFLPLSSPLGFAALTGPGTIGCTVGQLPPASANWYQSVFEQRAAPAVPAADLDPPRIDVATDGRYHGERLDLNKFGFDLGAHLAKELATRKPAPRVVLHLTGKGPCATSPLRINGVEQLVIYCEPAKTAGEQLILDFNPGPTPAIEMSGGSLELINVRVRLSSISIVPSIVQVQDGDLRLTRCWLQQGPAGKSGDGFHNLIAIGNTGRTPTTLLVRDSVLISGKTLVEMRDNVHLLARNNLLFSLGDGIVIDVNRPTNPLTHVLDHNTFAIRQQAVVLRAGPQFEAVGQTTMHANSNVFWSPFADAANQRAILRSADARLAHGQFRWQGRYNVYDARLPRFLASLPKQEDKQRLSDWQKTWGLAGEQDAIGHDAGLAAKTIALEGVTPATIVSQLDRLALPASVRGDPSQTPPGANLVSLGVQKKK